MIIAIANQKGGTGKTTTTVNLAGALAMSGRRVLVVDCDPQANATTALGINHTAQRTNLADVLKGAEISAAVLDVLNAQDVQDVLNVQDPPGCLHLVPSHAAALANAERELNAEMGEQFLLRDAIDTISANYSMIFLDCPPSLSGLTISALIASNQVLIPVTCEFLPLDGVGQLLATVAQIKRYYNPSLGVLGILPVRYDARRVADQVVVGMLDGLDTPVLSTRIRASVRVTEAQGAQQPLCIYDPSGHSAQDYRAAAHEIEGRLYA